MTSNIDVASLDKYDENIVGNRHMYLADLQHIESWLDKTRVCTSPYDLISHENVPSQLSEITETQDLSLIRYSIVKFMYL